MRFTYVGKHLHLRFLGLSEPGQIDFFHGDVAPEKEIVLRIVLEGNGFVDLAEGAVADSWVDEFYFWTGVVAQATESSLNFLRRLFSPGTLLSERNWHFVISRCVIDHAVFLVGLRNPQLER